MAFYANSEERARLGRLIAERERAKAGKKDRWGLRPIEKGWLRGHAVNIRTWEEPDDLGMLINLEFELRENPKETGVLVRMAGTDFNDRILDGQLMDVPDPDPQVRPIVTDRVYYAHRGRRDGALTAHYPGRRMDTPRKSLTLGLLAVVVPVVFVVAAVTALHYVFHII
jgi:hypothetical protein